MNIQDPPFGVYASLPNPPMAGFFQPVLLYTDGQMHSIPDGHSVTLEITVTDDMTVHFHELGHGPGHPVYSTYWIAKHFEEVGRKLLLPFREAGEEGVGTFVEVQHLASALPGMRVTHVATVQGMEGRRLTCTMSATSELGDLIATGRTGQYVTLEAKLERNFETLRERWQAYQQEKKG